MTNIARGQITIINNTNEHTFIKYSDDMQTMYDKPDDFNWGTFRPVEYLMNNATYTAYVPVADAGNIGTSMRIVIEFMVIETHATNTTTCYIFGNWTGTTKYYFLRYNRVQSRLEVCISATSSAASQLIYIPYQIRTKIKVDISTDRVIVNDTDIYYFPETRDATAFSSAYSMRYFISSNKTSLSSTNYRMMGRIYSIKVYQNDELKVDNAPVINLSNKFCTMYNKVLNKTDWIANTSTNANYYYGGYEIGENRILNSNFSNGLTTWDTSHMGENMTATVVQDSIKGSCVKLVCTDTTVIDENNNMLMDCMFDYGNRYLITRDVLTEPNEMLSFDAKCNEAGDCLYIYLRNASIYDKVAEVELTDQWERYEIPIQATTERTNRIAFGVAAQDAEYYITNIKVEYGTIATPWTPSPDDATSISTRNGIYMGTLVWDNNYPSPVFDDYTWVKVKGEDGEDGEDGTNGTNGNDGRGITSITEYYLATSASSGVTTSTSGWTTTIQTITNTNKYLWNYELVTYTDNTTAVTSPIIIGVYGDKGQDGTNGTNGKGITSITNYYLAITTSSGVTRSTSGWTTTVQTVTNTKKYLWNYEDILYTDNSHTYTDPHIIGVYGDKGNDGSSVVGTDAEFYRLLPKLEEAIVDINGTKYPLDIRLLYEIEHVKGTLVESLTSNTGWTVRFRTQTDASTYYNLTWNSTNHVYNYVNFTFYADYHTLSPKPTCIMVELLNTTSNKVVDSRVIPIVYFAGLSCQTNADLGIISNTVQGHTTSITQLENMNVGGRNYALNTSGEWSEWITLRNINNQTIYVCSQMNFPDDKQLGDNYTYQITIEWSSVEASNDGTFRIAAQTSVNDSWSSGINNPGWSTQLLNITTEPEDGIVKYVYTKALDDIRVNFIKPAIRIDYALGQMRYKCVKIERGSKPTDWSPAPEDINASITTVTNNVSNITQTMNNISSTVQSHTTSINNMNDSISDLEDDVSSLTQTANDISAELSHYEKKTYFDDLISTGTFFTLSDGQSGQSVTYDSSTNTYKLNQTSASQDIDYKNNPQKCVLDAGDYILHFIPSTSTASRPNYTQLKYYVKIGLYKNQNNITEYDVITLDNCLSKNNTSVLFEFNVPEDNTYFYFYIEDNFTSGSNTRWISITDLRITKELGANSLLKLTSDSITSTVEGVEKKIDASYLDEKNLFKQTSFNGGELNTGNKWEFINAGIECENYYWDNKKMVFYEGQTSWHNLEEGTSFVYSPALSYFSASKKLTLNLEFYGVEDKVTIELVRYNTLTDAKKMTNQINTYYITNSGSTTTTRTFLSDIYTTSVIQFVIPANGYYRIRFGSTILEYDEDGSYGTELNYVRLYNDWITVNDILEWNTGWSKSFSQISQTANEISLRVNDISLRLDGINSEIELNGNTKINGSLTLHDEEQGFILSNPDGTTQISPQSVGDYEDFEDRTVNVKKVYQSQSNPLYEEWGTTYYQGNLYYNYSLGTISAGTLITLINQSTNFYVQGNNSGFWIVTPVNVSVRYNIYEGATVKHYVTYNSSSVSNITTYTTTTSDEVRIQVAITVRFDKATVDNYLQNDKYMMEPNVTGRLTYYIELPTASFMLVGYDGLAVNFGNQKTAFISGDNTIFKYGNYGLKLSTGGLKKWNGSSWVGLNSLSTKSITGNYTLTEADDFIIFTGTSSDATLTLPTSNISVGKMIYVKDIGSKQLTVSCSNKIIQEESTSTSSSVGMSNRMHFFIWNGSCWFMGYCG